MGRPSISGHVNALANVDDDIILGRLAAGELASHIAVELGVHKSAIYHRYEDRADYKQAREYGMQVRVEEADSAIATAPDVFTLSRARECFRAVSWRAEREFPHRWGQKQQVLVGVAPTIDASLLGVASELLSRIASGQVIEQAKDVTDAELSTDTEPVDNLPDPGQK